MNFFQKLIGAGVSETVSAVGNVIAKVKDSHMSKREAELEVQSILAQADVRKHQEYVAELETQKSVMVEELRQTDVYTKRTRPLLLRRGFYLCAADMVATKIMMAFSIPTTFSEPEKLMFQLWGGLLGVYIIGRTAEKSGVGGKVVDLITGGNK